MNRTEIRKVVCDLIAELFGEPREFADDIPLQALGLDKREIEELIFRLEDQFNLTAFTREEDQLLDHSLTIDEVCRFVQEVSSR